jgi:hypothetical protein
MKYSKEDLILTRAEALVLTADWFAARIPAVPLDTVYEAMYLARHPPGHPDDADPPGKYQKLRLLDASLQVIARYLEEHPCLTRQVTTPRSTQG